tara:strand:+ start:246 stop:392 length:147 start_codon:yes stop_codon:yes gene_type:complete
LTLAELKEKLMQFDEIDLIELLDLTSEDILERFEDIVEDKFETLQKEI